MTAISRSGMLARMAVAFGAVAGIGAIRVSAAQQAPDGSSAPRTDPPATQPRAERLARQRAGLDAEIARCEAFGHREAFAAALGQLQKENSAFIDGKERWAQVARGWLPLMAIDHWVEWHLTAERRKEILINVR